MILNRKTFIVAVAILMLAAAGCSNNVVKEEFYQSYQVRSGTVVNIINPNGSVTLMGWDEDTVEIKAVKESLRGQDALDGVDINIDIADELLIETINLTDDILVSVSYDIKVPVDLLIGIIECANGNITLENVGGNPVLSTSNGTISAVNVNGIVSAVSSNGDITATGVRSLDEVKTSNGTITAELPAIYNNLEIATSNGSITLLLSPTLAVDIDAKTSNGSISISNLNIDAAEFDQTTLSGSMNGGGQRIEISTSNGSIELAQLK
jgi:DUF4097 and DUF4098 domain-containing protein YvlB